MLVTGETTNYGLDEIPDWVDSVYPTDMLMDQAKSHYTLKGGYFNSIFQRQGVMAVDSDEGAYNYVSIDDEIYIFAGIRPIKLDSSSTTGLSFMNRRTGEAMELSLPVSHSQVLKIRRSDQFKKKDMFLQPRLCKT
ncbi:hypothetical protein MGH68_03525 [Erysipelothrix sp. D19-032]